MKKDLQKLTRLIGGPKDGEITEREAVAGKIVISGVGFQPDSHVYKMSSILDNEGDKIAVYQEKKSNVY